MSSSTAYHLQISGGGNCHGAIFLTDSLFPNWQYYTVQLTKLKTMCMYEIKNIKQWQFTHRTLYNIRCVTTCSNHVHTKMYMHKSWVSAMYSILKDDDDGSLSASSFWLYKAYTYYIKDNCGTKWGDVGHFYHKCN